MCFATSSKVYYFVIMRFYANFYFTQSFLRFISLAFLIIFEHDLYLFCFDQLNLNWSDVQEKILYFISPRIFSKEVEIPVEVLLDKFRRASS